MQLSELERERLAAILEKYDQHPEVQRMREFIQHGDVTTYQHCKNVVLVSFWLNRRFHLGADETSLAVGAFLHDWPLTFRHMPTCREAVIVCLADKYCAVVESMFQRARVADADALDNEW